VLIKLQIEVCFCKKKEIEEKKRLSRIKKNFKKGEIKIMMNLKILLPRKKRNTHKLWRDLKTLNLKSSSLVTI